MAEDFDHEVETDEDPVFAAITPKKTTKWGLAALGIQFLVDVSEATTLLLTDMAGVLVRRHLYEEQRSHWAEQTAREIEALQGFYIVASEDEEEEDE